MPLISLYDDITTKKPEPRKRLVSPFDEAQSPKKQLISLFDKEPEREIPSALAEPLPSETAPPGFETELKSVLGLKPVREEIKEPAKPVVPTGEVPSPYARPLPSEAPVVTIPPDVEPKTVLGYKEPKTTLKQFVKAGVTGLGSGGAILIDTLEKAQKIGERAPLAPDISPKERERIEALKPRKFSAAFKKARAKLKPRENATRAERIAFQTGEMFGQVVAGMTTGAPLSTLSLASGTSKMDEVLEAGGSYEKGLVAGTAQAMVEWVTEKIPIGEYSKILKGKTKGQAVNFLKSSVKAIVTDVFGEITANAIERGAIDPVFLDREIPSFNQIWNESVDITLSVLLSGFGLSISTKALSKVREYGVTPPTQPPTAPPTALPPAPPKTATTEDISQVNNLIKSTREFIKPLSTIPQSEEFLAGRYRTLGRIYQVERIVKKIKDKTKNIPSEAKYDIFRFLNAEIPVSELSDKYRVMAKQIQNLFNISGKMLVKRGIISQETYDKHKNQYVPYLYLRHILDDNSIVGISPSGRLDLAYQKARKDLSKEYQRSIGLVEDVSCAAPVGIGRTLSDTVKFDRYADIANNPNWTFAPSRVEVEGKKIGIGELVEEVKIAEKMNRQAPNVPEIKERLDSLKTALKTVQEASKNIPKDFVQIPVSKKWGELSGAFVRKPIVRDLLPESRWVAKNPLSKIISHAIDLDAKAMAAFKVGKTAFNIPTVVRNSVSNLFQERLSGIPFHTQPKNMFKAAQAWKNRSKFLIEFERNGGFKTNWAIAEINSVFDAVKTMQKENSIVAGLKKMAGFYGKIDDFFRLNMFVYHRSRGVPVKDAMLEAQKWTMDYSLVHPSISAARRHIAPFVTFQYKIIPLVAEAAIKRPWVLAALLAVPAALTEIARRRLNLTEEEFEKAKNQLPTFLKNGGAYAPLLWRSKEGNLQWVNLEYYFPWSALMNTGRDVKEGRWNELAYDIGIGNPALDIYTVLKTTKGDTPPKDPFTGIPIYNQLDSPTDKALRLGEWVWNRWSPTMLTRYGTFGKASRIGEKDRYGREVTAGQAASSLFGANIISPTQQQGAAERYVKIKELYLSLLKITNDPTKSEEEKVKAQVEYERRVREITGGQ